MTSLYQQLNSQNQVQIPNKLKQLINNFKSGFNPQQLLFNYIQTNPMAQSIYLMLQNGNKSPKQLFYLMAKQKGIDPNSILNILK